MDREVFYPFDQPILVYEVRRPNTGRFDDPDGIPAEPVGVSIRAFDGTNGDLVVFEGGISELDLTSSYIHLDPMDEDEDRGALIHITLPPEMMEQTGSYTVYITTEYEDGLRMTTDQRVQVAEFR